MEDYSINISVKKNQISPNDLAKIVNFHFSHYKSMETLSCHSNQSSYPTEIKKITFVEGNVLSKYAKFSASSSLWFLRRRFLNIFTKIDPFCHPDNQSNTPIWTKVIRKPRGLLNKHFCKKKFQISPLRQKKNANFHFSHYKSMGTISCHSNQSSYPTGIKNITFRSPYL